MSILAQGNKTSKGLTIHIFNLYANNVNIDDIHELLFTLPYVFVPRRSLRLV